MKKLKNGLNFHKQKTVLLYVSPTWRNLIFRKSGGPILLSQPSFNPILLGIKSNLFYAGVGIYAHPRDFALAEAMMHQNL